MEQLDKAKLKRDEQIALCTEIINLALRLENSHAKLLIMSRANDLRHGLRSEKNPPELI